MTILTALIPFSAHSLLHTLGWTLFHFCWQGAIVAILLWCVLGLLTGRSPQLRYTAACCALASMVLFPILTFERIAAATHSTTHSIASATFVWNPAVSLGGGQITEPWLDRLARTLDNSVPWALGIWFAGAIVLLIRLNIGLIVAQRMKSVATAPVSLELQRTFQQLCLRLGVTRSIKLMSSTLVQAPAVIGWLRPVILVPASCLTGLSTAQIEAILAHELAHIRRHDYLVSVFQSVVEALFFYHPAVWWVSKQLRREREHCCDDLAVRIGGDSLAYARALSTLEEHRSSTYVTALGANGGVLTMRIKRLLGYKENPAVSQLASLTLLAVVLTAAGLWITSIAHAQPISAPATSDALRQSSSTQNTDALLAPYKNWLDQDVVWIITRQESEAFINLKNNDERDRFIEQFWQRRNPDPNSAQNTYRAEHYHRIAYTNAHFAAGGPGWKTARGHIYIVNGPPESVDSHPAGDKDSDGKPVEVWHYDSLSGPAKNVDITFIDDCNCGDYRLHLMNGSTITSSGEVPFSSKMSYGSH